MNNKLQKSAKEQNSIEKKNNAGENDNIKKKTNVDPKASNLLRTRVHFIDPSSSSNFGTAFCGLQDVRTSSMLAVHSSASNHSSSSASSSTPPAAFSGRCADVARVSPLCVESIHRLTALTFCQLANNTIYFLSNFFALSISMISTQRR